jgi:hypothetical protein
MPGCALTMGMDRSRTPDLDRLDFAFTSSTHPIRVAAARRALVDVPLAAGPHVLTGRSHKTQHVAMRGWVAMVRSALKLRVTWSGHEAIDPNRQYFVRNCSPTRTSAPSFEHHITSR